MSREGELEAVSYRSAKLLLRCKFGYGCVARVAEYERSEYLAGEDEPNFRGLKLSYDCRSKFDPGMRR